MQAVYYTNTQIGMPWQSVSLSSERGDCKVLFPWECEWSPTALSKAVTLFPPGTPGISGHCADLGGPTHLADLVSGPKSSRRFSSPVVWSKTCMDFSRA